MAHARSDLSSFQSDIKKILLEARQRWLRPAEICEILRNHQNFDIDSEPPHRPPSGSVFLFDRKVLRYFRKDGHDWRKKKDGKTVREAHEKLKVGSIDMLHCYYAHGEGNETFQRRSYWLLEQDLMHIVFVHYLEVKGMKANTSSAIDTENFLSSSQDNSLSFNRPSKHSKGSSSKTDSTSPTSTVTSACDDAESEDNHQASSRLSSFLEGPPGKDRHVMDHKDTHLLSSYNPHPCSDFVFEQGNGNLDKCLRGVDTNKQELWRSRPAQASYQVPLEDCYKQPNNKNLSFDSTYFETSVLKSNYKNLHNVDESFRTVHDETDLQFGQSNLQEKYSNLDSVYTMESNSENDMTAIGTGNYPFVVRPPLLDGPGMEEGLKKVDSFSRWIAKELGEVDELHMQSTNGIPWSYIESVDANDDSTVPTQLQLDADSIDPSISQDQLFTIIKFFPNSAYSNLSTKVFVIGTFLTNEPEVKKCKWSCMFGEIEVPAEVLASGILCCDAPSHSPGQVPFYVTCSNRLACSEVREFEFRDESAQDTDITDSKETNTNTIITHTRLERLLSQCGTPNCTYENGEIGELVGKLIILMEEQYYSQPRLLKEKLFLWLLYKVNEDGKGPSVVDEAGQGVLHLVSALGFNWALRPVIVSGVHIDFRDVNGWTALHWAAFSGKEETVAALISMGANPGALTDPSLEFPLGRTPADLASINGHKGISGFLAESSLTKYLSSLAVADPDDTLSQRLATPISDANFADELSLKDSLAAVCNATQAASRIHQIFRMQSFQRKKFTECEDEELDLSSIFAKPSRLGRNDGNTHAAAICIQKKYRGWKKRKEFLIIKQRIVKIQAHVRGHQVRKKYKSITWSVGILEKVILRWRRKGTGLRGFQKSNSSQEKEDEYDFLKDGRKQNEERLQKALSRVKSMVQYPEGRAQYRRLLTVTGELRENKRDGCDMVVNSSEDMEAGYDDLIDIEPFLDDDDAFMSIAFQ